MLWYHLFNLEFIANTTAGGGRGSPPSALAVAGGTPDRSETTGVRMRTAASLLSGAILLLAITLLPLPPAAYAQDETAIGVDAITEGNTATSLGPHDSCVSVDKGETFDVDIFIADVTDLLAWEAYLAYDNAVVQVVDRDVDMFQAADPGSSVFNTSESVPPNEDGLFRAGGTDLIDPPVGDSGSGVLARLTLEALDTGRTTLSIEPIDLDEDPEPDIGPLLRHINGKIIGDTDGDSFFDGPFSTADVAVGTDCTGAVSAASDDGGGWWSWWMTVIIAAGAGAALLAAVAYRFSSKARTPSVGAGDQ